MINLTSTLDGLRLILGSPYSHLAAFLTILSVINKPPDYFKDVEGQNVFDEKRTKDAH